MNELILNIAGYILKFNFNIYNNINNNQYYNINTRFSGFLLPKLPEGKKADLEINVHAGNYNPDHFRDVFRAALPEGTEIAGGKSIPEFWSVVRSDDAIFLKVSFPENNSTALLRFSPDSAEWDLWIENSEGATDPLEYPLDGLLFYYLTVLKRDIMMHASGIRIGGKGLIFSGVSGKGKSTIAALFMKAGAEVIHDDRLILRKKAGGYTMHNTPVYPGEKPVESTVDRIYLIEHGIKNSVEKLSGANSISRLMANCIQHNWEHDIVSRHLVSVNDLGSSVPVYRLAFVPDSNVVNFIMENE